ncbi:hypothetical protein PMAYCL1PPCAC_23856, partial [Pristionchus mayeri]
SLKSKSTLGLLILLVVNILWVLSGEITRFIFIDYHFHRPFFLLSFKSSLLSIYFLRYLYKPMKIKLREVEEEIDELSVEGFELMSEEENESEKKKVRFSETKEIRRMPQRIAFEAKVARMAYSASFYHSFPSLSSATLITLFVLLPTWILSSFTYQVSLLFTSLSSLNLLSASSPVFVLILSICLPSSNSLPSPLKCLVVLINLFGVALLSQTDSISSPSIELALFSAFCYAFYLVSLSNFVSTYGQIDTNFLFGSIGIVSTLISLFLLPFLDWIRIEELLPFPPFKIWMALLASTFLGTLVADRLWMEATLLTSSLVASLSTSLSIPLSFLMDSLLRQEYPSSIQLIASIPITLSIIGASVLEGRKGLNGGKTGTHMSIERESLIDNEHS